MKIIDFPEAIEGFFEKRLNRFLGIVKVKGDDYKVHIRDSGRLEELLYKGNRVMIIPARNKNRKTNYDLLSADSPAGPVLVNSGLHRVMFLRLLRNRLIFKKEVEFVQPEIKLGESRIDFLVKVDGKEYWIETKGCTLTRNGVALFPDAPTIRGRRHISELINVKKQGGEAILVFLIFRRDSVVFSPNFETDPSFGRAFQEAIKEGVEVLPLVFGFEGKELHYLREIPILNSNHT